jgi:hypothetical protein
VVAAEAVPSKAAVLNRSVLPIPEQQFPVITELDARNVVIVLIHDIDFGRTARCGRNSIT